MLPLYDSHNNGSFFNISEIVPSLRCRLPSLRTTLSSVDQIIFFYLARRRFVISSKATKVFEIFLINDTICISYYVLSNTAKKATLVPFTTGEAATIMHFHVSARCKIALYGHPAKVISSRNFKIKRRNLQPLSIFPLSSYVVFP